VMADAPWTVHWGRAQQLVCVLGYKLLASVIPSSLLSWLSLINQPLL